MNRYERSRGFHSEERFYVDVLLGTIRWPNQKASEEIAVANHQKHIAAYIKAEKENIALLRSSLVRVLAARFGEAFAPAKTDVDEIFAEYEKQELESFGK